MLKLKTVKRFEKNYERVLKSSKPATATRIKRRMGEVIDCLIKGHPIPPSFCDHDLKDNRKFKNCRDCHILGDLVLVYKVEDGTCTLLLLDLDTHSNLFEDYTYTGAYI